MSAFDDYIQISVFLNRYLCKEMLMTVQSPPPFPAETGPHGEELSEYSFYRDLLFDCSTGDAILKLNRELNANELAYIAERIEGFLIENCP